MTIAALALVAGLVSDRPAASAQSGVKPRYGGQKYSFDPGLGNTGRGAIPIHGFLTGADAWKVVETKADSKSAWATMKLDFFRVPRYMKQFPFAHTLTIRAFLDTAAWVLILTTG